MTPYDRAKEIATSMDYWNYCVTADALEQSLEEEDIIVGRDISLEEIDIVVTNIEKR